MEVYSGIKEEVYWLMNPKTDYVPFWVKGGSDKLDRCASIYGCQGFETDYVGVIWGRDFVLRDGTWQVGDHCEDSKTGRPSLKKIMELSKGNDQSRGLALQLLKNRYRIFLTRGIKGTYVFCEDAETAKFLQTLAFQSTPLPRTEAKTD